MTVTSRGAGYVEIELDLIPALRREILDAIKDIALVQLVPTNVASIPDEQGVYFPYYQPMHDVADSPVYIGKTDSDAGLRSRLMRHSYKLDGRENISPTEVYFRAVRLFVFTPMDIEGDLIEFYGGVKSINWNGSGFGSNDPGTERDTTNYKADHFDTRFPIDYGRSYFDMPAPTMSVAEAMTFLKRELPYNLRFQRPKPKSTLSFHPDFQANSASFRPGMTVKDQVASCIAALPKGWHATALPSHIIVYKDDTRKLPSGKVIAKS
jgi:hypothetical protein